MFQSEQYNGSESSGFVEVTVIISGGLSTTPISVMVTITTAGQSARDKQLARGNIYIIIITQSIK